MLAFPYDWQLKTKEELDETALRSVTIIQWIQEMVIDGYSVMYLFGSVLDLKKICLGLH